MSTDTKMPQFSWDDRISRSDHGGERRNGRVENPLSDVVNYVETLPGVEVGDVTVRVRPPNHLSVKIRKPYEIYPSEIEEIVRLLGGGYDVMHNKTRRLDAELLLRAR